MSAQPLVILPAAPQDLQPLPAVVTSEVTPENVRPYPKAPPRPYGKGQKRVRACILTKNEEVISDLQTKDEKMKKAEEKMMMGAGKKSKLRRQAVPKLLDGDEEDDPAVPLMLGDSSENSSELEGDMEADGPYPFAVKEPEVGDFVVIELELEEGRNSGAPVHYVCKMMNTK
ncbi:uncharacterized protein LOC135223685 [Macrobrachium nipponense]|uniref:uncharacterized protein LOC135223685 n=1 Tax=Macrobrachium nipponense TaxID=159736 RepID=UPI0030C8AB50